jgi:hypothetical protein
MLAGCILEYALGIQERIPEKPMLAPEAARQPPLAFLAEKHPE